MCLELTSKANVGCHLSKFECVIYQLRIELIKHKSKQCKSDGFI